NGDKGSGTDRANAKQTPGADLLQKSGTDETSDHCPTPVEGHEAGRYLFGKSANLRLAEVVDQEASDGDLGPDVNKDADRAKDQIRMLPDGVIHFFANPVLRMFDLRQFETGNRDRQHD